MKDKVQLKCCRGIVSRDLQLFYCMNIERWGQTIYYGTRRHQLVQEWENTLLCHTERWQVKQTALSIWLLLTSGSHCLKEVPASVLDLLAIKVQFNQNLKETWGLMLIHPCWPHVGHAGCQFFSDTVGGRLQYFQARFIILDFLIFDFYSMDDE